VGCAPHYGENIFGYIKNTLKKFEENY